MYYQDLPNEFLNVQNKKIINQSKLDIELINFEENDTIIINSGTGTSKTRNVGEILSKLKKPNERILSVVNLISLAREQIKTFKEVGDLDLLDYQDGTGGFKVFDGVICINSLLKLSDPIFKFDNVILYIDEIDDLIKSFTHNDSLDIVLKPVFVFLIYIIKTCKKLILSDATINQNTLNLISCRRNKKEILIKNTNKKFQGVQATCCNDENIFLDKLKECIKNKEYFLFGCDLCTKIEFFHDNLIKLFPEQKDKFLLITSKRKFKITDANSQFKDKYIFYSPSVKTGVSFYIETAQKQFIYIGEKSITPIGNYQQTCRTRNMKELIYYCTDQNPTENKYMSLTDLENAYKKMIERNKLLNDMCLNINKNDELEFCENSFFKLFCYEEYLRRIYRTGYKQHFENYLVENGFNIVRVGDKDKLDRHIYEVFKMEKELKDAEDFDEFKKEIFEEIKEDITDEELEEQMKKQEENIKKYPILHLRHNLLQVPKKDIEKYIMFYTDEHILKKYYGILNLFRTEEYIKEKINNKKQNNFYVKILFDILTKINLLSQVEKHYKIERFNLNMKDIIIDKKLSDEFINLCKDIFRLDDLKFDTKENIKDSYISMIKNISGSKSYKDELSLINVNRVGKKRTREYKINSMVMKNIISLLKYSNPKLKNMNCELIEKQTGIKPELEEKTEEPKREITVKPENDKSTYFNKWADEYEKYKYDKTFKF